jgi:hypothetical protein
LLKLEERGDKGDSDDDLFNILKEWGCSFISGISLSERFESAKDWG